MGHGIAPLGRFTAVLAWAAAAVAALWMFGAPHDLRLVATIVFGAGAAGVGLWLFVRSFAVLRSIGDVPTSRLASANQGLVEVVGTARLANTDLTSLKPRHVWHRIVIEERSSRRGWLPGWGHWSATHVETSDRPFAVEDGTAAAIVLPYGATVLCASRTVTREDGRRVTREAIRPGERVYVLGQLTSHQDAISLEDETNRIAADWRMQPEKRDAFDSNRNGVLDTDELLRLHVAAQVEARRELRRPQPDETHVIMAPPDQPAFVISTLPVRDLFRGFALRALAGAALFIGGIAIAGTMLAGPFATTLF